MHSTASRHILGTAVSITTTTVLFAQYIPTAVRPTALASRASTSSALPRSVLPASQSVRTYTLNATSARAFFAPAMAAANKIKVKNPIVEMDGDEMTVSVSISAVTNEGDARF